MKALTTSPITSHPKQLEIWRDKSRFKVVCAGRRFGKTFYSIESIAYHLCQPRQSIAYCAPTRSQAKDIIWEPLKERLKQFKWNLKINESELVIERLKTKSKVRLYSGDAYERMRGKWFTHAILDECADIDREVWLKVIRPALSDKRGSAIFISSPKGFNFFHELYQSAKTRKNWSAFTFKTIDSPFFQTPEGRKEIDDAKEDLDEKSFRQEYEASFETFAGRVCYAFDRTTNHHEYKFDPKLPIIVGMDFNILPMTACIFQKKEGKLYQFDEFSLHSSSTDELCREIIKKYPNSKIFVRPDASGKNRHVAAQKSSFEIIQEFGFIIEVGRSNPARIDRWASQNRAFERKLVMIDTNKCPKTTKDLETLCYKEGTCEPDLKGKLHGHLFDANGYSIYWEFPIMKKRVTKQYTI